MAAYTLEIDSAANAPDEVGNRIQDQLKDRPEIAKLVPLLGAVLAIDIPENQTTRHMSGVTRGENTRRLLHELVRLAAQRQPTLIVLEDVHWIDSASWALAEQVSSICDAVKMTLDQTPPELAADIMERGVCLAGGGALLHGLAVRIRDETGMPVFVCDRPLEAVALGSGQSLEEFESLRGVLFSSGSI